MVDSTRRTAADDDREDNGWILGEEENSEGITTYERPKYIVRRKRSTCDKK